MKKLGMFITAILIGFTTFAQIASVKATPESMKQGVKQGVFEFVMPASTSVSEINRTAGYYVDYFNVAFDDATKKATITMVDNTPEGRRVVSRFLLSNKVSVIAFDGKEFKITEFYDKYMKE